MKADINKMTLFLHEYIDSENHEWAAVYKKISTTHLQFIGSINITNRYFLKGTPFDVAINNILDENTLIIGHSNKLCKKIDSTYPAFEVIQKVSNDKTIKTFSQHNEELHNYPLTSLQEFPTELPLL